LAKITKKSSYKKHTNFIFIAILATLITFVLSIYIANLLFGKNSLEVYNALKIKRLQLQRSIKDLQFENAKLQKEYFELKNLEPEER
jgi:cell division protein FtsB